MLLELEIALNRILGFVPPALAQRVPLDDAHGRWLLEAASATVDLPPFDNSSMDGYAVRSADLITAGVKNPVFLKLSGQAAAGAVFQGKVVPGSCVRVFTGSVLPPGADAVVMQEDTEILAETGEVGFREPIAPLENVRRQSEDVPSGKVLLERGERVNAAALCLLAASGVSRVQVGKRPAIGIVATGSELRAPGTPLGPGQIYESNRLGISALARGAGALPRVFPLVTDSLDHTRQVLAEAFGSCDLVVTSGGVSVGEMDLVKQAFKDVGGQLEFWKVAIKPGKPFVFGRRDGKLLFGLPGNPVSALVTFFLLVRPALLRWQGARDVSPPLQAGLLGEGFENPGDRRHFVRVVMRPDGSVQSAGTQGSHRLSSMAAANGLLDLPPGAALKRGTLVNILRWDA